MENRKFSPDEDKEKEIKKLQEKLKASGNKLQASLQEHRKKLELSQNTKLGDLPKKSQSPVPSTSSDSVSSLHSKTGRTKTISFSASQKTTTLKTELSNSNNSIVTPSVQEQNGDSVKNSELKDKIDRIKTKLRRFERNNYDAQRYVKSSSANSINRTRSISERSSSSASSIFPNNFATQNIRQRSTSGNYTTANSEVSYAQTSNINTKTNQNRKKSVTDTNNENSTKLRKRSRGKRGSKSKTKETQANAEHIPCYAKECDSLYVNAETLLILDLLYLPLEQHTDYLLNLAKIRKIILPNSDDNSYIYNPELNRFNSILQLGNQCRNFSSDDLKRLEHLMSNNHEDFSKIKQKKQQQKLVRLDSESKRNGERKSIIFEDYINEIVGEYLPEDKREQFLFPKLPRSQRTKNYINEPKFEAELEKYAQRLVDANLGVIVEGDIRINGKNNDQAFVKNVTGRKDAFVTSVIARKYALNGDVVRIFVRNDDSEKQPCKFIIDGCLQNNIENLQSSDNNNINNEFKKLSISSNDPQPGPSNAANIIEDESSMLPPDFNVSMAADELDELNNSTDILSEQENEIISGKSSKAFVLKIVNRVHNRKCVGSFLSYRKDSEYITFVPRDLKMPNIRIYKSEWPEAFKKGELQSINDVLYEAQITDWQNGVCTGKILHPIGKCGELEFENKAILLQNGLEMDPYEEKYNEMFYGPLIITEEDVKVREDLRSECIFTIDPLTARDLDDAMSCKTLENGNYEIGVHISDVTHFLEEQSELDEIVALRSTSVYMVNEVFHMLPKPLCYKCSLLPGEDKFAVSCFWEVAPSGDILNTRMSRTILNSCTQFAYEHAQKIIDNPDKAFVNDDFPQIHNNWSVDDIVERVKTLNSIAEIWREKRFDQGALKINRPKLYFHLNGESGEPTEFFQAIMQPANFLIEEYMLMANQSVADFIYKKFPKIALLRNHDPPLSNVIQKVHFKLKHLGLNLDISNSKSLYSSLTKLISCSNNPRTLEVCLTHLISKPMSRAKYFCSEKMSAPNEFWHYALSIPIYTHFTSPIRRYPDILVHRVLTAALGYNKAPKRTPDELHIIASICNEKKYTAKLAGEDSSNLYFMYYIKTKKCVLMKAAVLECFFRSMEVILLVSGHQIRVSYPNEKSNIKINFNPQTKIAVIINEKGEEIELKPFSEIDVEVYVDKFKIKARLPGSNNKKQKNEIGDNQLEANVIQEIILLASEQKKLYNNNSDFESNSSSNDKNNLLDASIITNNEDELLIENAVSELITAATANNVENNSEIRTTKSENNELDLSKIDENMTLKKDNDVQD